VQLLGCSHGHFDLVGNFSINFEDNGHNDDGMVRGWMVVIYALKWRPERRRNLSIFTPTQNKMEMVKRARH